MTIASAWLGRLVGAAVGLLGGPLGVAFGLVAGWLVDEVRRANASLARHGRFRRHPERERSHREAVSFATADLLEALLLCDGVAHVGLEELALGRPWPGPALADAVERHRYLEQARILSRRGMASSPPAASARRIAAVPRGSDAGGELLELLVHVACADEAGMSASERVFICGVADGLGIDTAEVGRLEAHYGGLDERHCLILGVTPDADREEVRQAYRRLAAQLHPDTAAALEEYRQTELSHAFARVHDAWVALDAQLRAREGIAEPVSDPATPKR